MIDRHSRRTLAEAFRHVATGRLTWAGFAARLDVATWDPNDPALEALCEAMYGWHDDLALWWTPGKPPREARRDIARMVLFLHSDREYRWPPDARFLDLLLGVVDLGSFGLTKPYTNELRYKPPGEPGDDPVWPFYTVEEYAAARRTWFLLGGEATTSLPDERITVRDRLRTFP